MNAYLHNAEQAGNKARADWTCPYPHHARNGAKPDLSPTQNLAAADREIDTVCADSRCLQPLQYCAACGASNRSLAKFCRNCCQPLAFEEAIIKFQAAHEIDSKKLIKEFRQIELPEMPGRPLSAMATGWGYLLVAAQGWGLGVLANTRLQPPRWLAHFKIDSGETIDHVHTLRPAEAPPGFVAVGAQHVYRVDFLPELRCKTLFRLPDPAWTISATLLLGASLVVRAWHRQSNWYRWLLLDCNTEQFQALPFQQRGAMSEMIAAAETGKLLYHTLNEIVQLDVRAGTEHRQAGPPCGLNLNVRPQLLARTGEVFLCGLDGALYRCPLAEAHVQPEVFGRGRHELVHMFLNAYDDYLYLLCRDNLVLIDHPSGTAIWNAQQHAKTLIHCGRLQPQQWGNYLIFSMRNSASSETVERVALFSFGQRGAPLLLHPAAAQTPAPVAGITNLIAARARQDQKPGEPAALLLFQF